jgi:hypothetical protein
MLLIKIWSEITRRRQIRIDIIYKDIIRLLIDDTVEMRDQSMSLYS